MKHSFVENNAGAANNNNGEQPLNDFNRCSGGEGVAGGGGGGGGRLLLLRRADTVGVLPKETVGGGSGGGGGCTSASDESMARSSSMALVKEGENCSDRWATPKRYSPSKMRACRQIGQIDPSLYTTESSEDIYDKPPGHLGRIWLNLNYNQTTEQLNITVQKARNLNPGAAHRVDAPTDYFPDCYIRVSLEHDKRRKIHTTSVKEHTTNPDFNEIFCFQIPQEQLVEDCINVTAYYINRHKRPHTIGFAHQELKALSNGDTNIRVWKDLENRTFTDSLESIQLEVALTYHPQQERLVVSVFECENWPTKDGEPLSMYVKVGLYQGLQGKEIKTKRTDIPASNTCAFNQSVNFHKIADIDQFYVRIILMQNVTSIGALFDKPIAEVILGNELFTNNGEHWNMVKEFPQTQIKKFHRMQLL